VAVPDSREEVVAAFVHTHGTRLVRLAHLFGADDPHRAAAAAMASTLLRWGRHGDAHDDLLTAARSVGSLGRPPVHEDVRLQGWLDRAEASAYEVDVDALRAETGRELEIQRTRRSATRRRTGLGVAAAVLAIAAVSAVIGDEQPPSQPDGLGRLTSEEPVASEGVALVDLPPAGSLRLPAELRSQKGVVAVADVLLHGPALAIARVEVAAGPATMLAIEGTNSSGDHVVAVLAVPDGESFLLVDESDLVAVMRAPRRDRLLSSDTPLTLRQTVVEDFQGRNLLLEVTSSRIDHAFVTLADSKQVLANRYSVPRSEVALFVAVDDDSVAEITYIVREKGAVRHRSLYTATP